MNKKTKKRLIITTLGIVVIMLVTVALVSSGGASRPVSIAQAVSGEFDGQRIEVQGTVVDDSYKMTGNKTSFRIYDPEAGSRDTLEISYTGMVSATFGNGVVAICTGKIGADGALEASTLVTKCPSKYESAEGAVTVEYLLRQYDVLSGQELKVAGYVKDGSVAGIGSDSRFVIYSQGSEIPVRFEDGLPEGFKEGSAVVVTGKLSDNKAAPALIASSVALDSEVY
jgi:cytochrome c-type biogenesis protein CcmE